MNTVAPCTTLAKSRRIRFLFLAALFTCSSTAFRTPQRLAPTLKSPPFVHASTRFDDLVEEIVFSGDIPTFIRKSSPTDAVLTSDFRAYVAATLQASTDDDEKAVLEEISALIASRLADNESDNDAYTLSAAAAPTSSSANNDADANEDGVDWRVRMKQLQFDGEDLDTTGQQVDKLGVFEKKKERVAVAAAVGITDLGQKTADGVAELIRRREEAALRAAEEEAERIRTNNKIVQQF